jgi:two-component system, NarL family, response regulator DevR
MENMHRQDTPVFVVEDSAEVRERLTRLIGDIEGVALAGSAAAVAPAIEGILRTGPRFVVLDLHLSDGSGMEVLRRVHPRAPEITFIVLTNHPEPHYRNACMRIGASHFLDKHNEFSKVREIIAAATMPAIRRPLAHIHGGAS